MTAKEHYDKHLGRIYSWMSGDFATRQSEFRNFLDTHRIVPNGSRVAIDLGAGHGIQSTALAMCGFKVEAIDFNDQLLQELSSNAAGLDVHVSSGNILDVRHWASHEPDLIVCWGDTLTHLGSMAEVNQLLTDIAQMLPPGGKVMLGFRDYSTPLHGASRFIPVKSDDDRIMTCFLEYTDNFVTVTDLLHERTPTGWMQSVSSYRKLRVSADHVRQQLEKGGLTLVHNGARQGMITMIATR